MQTFLQSMVRGHMCPFFDLACLKLKSANSNHDSFISPQTTAKYTAEEKPRYPNVQNQKFLKNRIFSDFLQSEDTYTGESDRAFSNLRAGSCIKISKKRVVTNQKRLINHTIFRFFQSEDS